MNGPSSSASTVSQKCRVSIGETSGRGGLRWPWLVSGLQLSLSALGCLAGQRDGVVGEIQRRRTTPPCLGRRRGVAAARRLARRRRGSSHKAKPPGVSKSSSRSLGGGGAPGRRGDGWEGSAWVLGFWAGARPRRPRRARRFFCDGYLSSGRWSFPCVRVSMSRGERSGVTDGFRPQQLHKLGPTIEPTAEPITPEAAPAASKRVPDGFHPRRRGRAEGGSFPFPQTTGRGARRRRSRAPFPFFPRARLRRVSPE